MKPGQATIRGHPGRIMLDRPGVSFSASSNRNVASRRWRFYLKLGGLKSPASGQPRSASEDDRNGGSRPGSTESRLHGDLGEAVLDLAVVRIPPQSLFPDRQKVLSAGQRSGFRVENASVPGIGRPIIGPETNIKCQELRGLVELASMLGPCAPFRAWQMRCGAPDNGEQHILMRTSAS